MLSLDIEKTRDTSKWHYTGDKVHISVASDQVKDAWNLILPILIEHHDTIKEFKVTDMEEMKHRLEMTAGQAVFTMERRLIYCMPLLATKTMPQQRFAKVLKGVIGVLTSAASRPGEPAR